jgi:hypothetical protein
MDWKKIRDMYEYSAVGAVVYLKYRILVSLLCSWPCSLSETQATGVFSTVGAAVYLKYRLLESLLCSWRCSVPGIQATGVSTLQLAM